MIYIWTLVCIKITTKNIKADEDNFVSFLKYIAPLSINLVDQTRVLHQTKIHLLSQSYISSKLSSIELRYLAFPKALYTLFLGLNREESR